MPKDDGKLITLQDAWRILMAEIAPLDTCCVPSEEALGGYLADPLLADRDIPAADRAAMDGYALRASDLVELPARLEVIGEVFAGSPDAPSIARGSCVRIFTGANVPPDADTVVPVEQTSTRSFRDNPADTQIEITKPIEPGSNIFCQGENARAGDVLVAAGRRLGPRQVSIAAATGYDRVVVHRRPRIGILTTGEELLDASQAAAKYQVRDSNGPMLVAALLEAGFSQVTRRCVPDTEGIITEAIYKALLESDAIILTGGISAGLHDYVPDALAGVGATILYRGIAMKPGKPQLFAKSATGQPVFGLPGNPMSSIVGLYELVLPALKRMSGCPVDHCRPSLYFPLAEAVRNSAERVQLAPAIIETGPAGTQVRPLKSAGSADLVTGSKADGAILLPAAVGSLPAGEIVQFRPWGGVGA